VLTLTFYTVTLWAVNQLLTSQKNSAIIVLKGTDSVPISKEKQHQLLTKRGNTASIIDRMRAYYDRKGN